MKPVLPQQRYHGDAQTSSRGCEYKEGREILSCEGLAHTCGMQMLIHGPFLQMSCRVRLRLSIHQLCLLQACLFGSSCNGSLHLAAWRWRTLPSLSLLSFHMLPLSSLTSPCLYFTSRSLSFIIKPCISPTICFTVTLSSSSVSFLVRSPFASACFLTRLRDGV